MYTPHVQTRRASRDVGGRRWAASWLPPRDRPSTTRCREKNWPPSSLPKHNRSDGQWSNPWLFDVGKKKLLRQFERITRWIFFTFRSSFSRTHHYTAYTWRTFDPPPPMIGASQIVPLPPLSHHRLKTKGFTILFPTTRPQHLFVGRTFDITRNDYVKHNTVCY